MNSFTIDEKTIQNALPPNVTLDNLSLRYLKDTFNSIFSKIDSSKITNSSDIYNFISNNFPGNGQLQIYIDQFLPTKNLTNINSLTPTNINDFKFVVFNAIISWFISSDLPGRKKISIDLPTLLSLITKDKALFYPISQYMPPPVFQPYNIVAPTNNSSSVNSMADAINTLNQSPAGKTRPLKYDSQGLQLLSDLLSNVVYASQGYGDTIVQNTANALPVDLPQEPSSATHNLTSKIFTLIIYALKNANLDLNAQNLQSILPKIPNYDYISIFLIYPISF